MMKKSLFLIAFSLLLVSCSQKNSNDNLAHNMLLDDESYVVSSENLVSNNHIETINISKLGYVDEITEIDGLNSALFGTARLQSKDIAYYDEEELYADTITYTYSFNRLINAHIYAFDTFTIEPKEVINLNIVDDEFLKHDGAYYSTYAANELIDYCKNYYQLDLGEISEELEKKYGNEDSIIENNVNNFSKQLVINNSIVNNGETKKTYEIQYRKLFRLYFTWTFKPVYQNTLVNYKITKYQSLGTKIYLVPESPTSIYYDEINNSNGNSRFVKMNSNVVLYI